MQSTTWSFYNAETMSQIRSEIDNTLYGTNGDDVFLSNRNGTLIYAFAGNDTVEAMGLNDTLDGGSGTDTLVLDYTGFGARRSGGNDYVRMRTASGDLATTLAEATEVYGYENIGSYPGYAAYSTVISGFERLEATGYDYNDNFAGGDLDDTLRGGAGNDTLWGNAGNDIIEGGDGDDRIQSDHYGDIDGGEGLDEITIDLSWTDEDIAWTDASGVQDFTIGSGDTLTRVRGFEWSPSLTLGSGNDTVEMDGTLYRNDSISAGAGDDSINGGLGADTLDGGSGTDTLVLDYTGFGARRSGGNDYVRMRTASGDLATTLAEATEVYGYENIGSYPGYAAYSTVISGFERLEATGYDYNDNFAGGDLDDTLRGGAGNDTLWGNAGNDIIAGGDGNDSISAGSGDDQIFYSAGADTIDGGDGVDRLIVDGLRADYQLTVSGASMAVFVYAGQTVQLENIEYLVFADQFEYIGSKSPSEEADWIVFADRQAVQALAGDDTVEGSSFGDTISGGFGADHILGKLGNDLLQGGDDNDTLDGGFSRDTLQGGAGDDLLIGGYGDDSLDGGTGSDTADYSGFGGNIVVNLNLAGAQNTNAGGTDTLTDIENLIGGDFADRFVGGTGASVLEGGNSSDTLYGLGGDDTLDGQSGNDQLLGGTGADLLIGGDGFDVMLGGSQSDTLQGGAGNDQLRGGTEGDTLEGGLGRDILIGGDFSGGGFPGDGAADVFVFNSAAESTRFGAGRDIIRDFEDGLDMIDVSGIDADEGTAGNQAFTLIGTAAFSHTAGELRYVNTAAATLLRGDTDGDGVADFDVYLNGVIALDGSDFIL
ncbi:calcium-binding protein [Tropicibacter naphthalenivorans]|nr:calcium-binding protein [Tropicibacter naphthalenivorans]